MEQVSTALRVTLHDLETSRSLDVVTCHLESGDAANVERSRMAELAKIKAGLFPEQSGHSHAFTLPLLVSLFESLNRSKT